MEMKIRFNDLSRAIDLMRSKYSIAETSSLLITMKEDDPGNGTIIETLNLMVRLADDSKWTSIEIYSGTEGKKPIAETTEQIS
jgi:hypothetical protein